MFSDSLRRYIVCRYAISALVKSERFMFSHIRILPEDAFFAFA
jgi:hypothetical protein